MVDPQIEKLLIVQHRDVELLKIQQDLTRLPAERKAAEAAIAKEQGMIEAARQSLLAKELARKEVDAEVKAKAQTGPLIPKVCLWQPLGYADCL